MDFLEKREGTERRVEMEEYSKKISEGIAVNMSEAERDNLSNERGFERVGPPLA